LAPQRSLVTGGAGFIGSTLVDELVAAGHEVTVLDDLSTGRLHNLDDARSRGAQLVELDVRDASAVDFAVGDARPEWIFHLAAQIDVRRSVTDPGFDAAVNILGTVNLLEAARRHGAARFVNTSTGGAIYGAADVVPTPEDTVERPMAGYGTSKLCAEHYCDLYARLHGLSTATVRLANVYGPRQDPLGEAGVIAIFCDRLLAGERPTIYGDGHQTRDFVYVGDVVAAQMAVAASDHAGPLNVGTGRESSVLELVGAVAEAGGAAPEAFTPLLEDARPGEIHRSCLDTRAAAREIDFRASVGLVDGLSRTLDWVRAVRRTRSAAPR
jgi:UDP-glucose 4-epimerase